MTDLKRKYYEKRANVLIKNLHSHHFEACYCADKAEALKKALEWIPAGSSVGWGGAMSAQQIGLLDTVRTGDYRALDRERAATPEEQKAIMKQCLGADVFITGANALSLDGQMVNIDGNGNRVSSTLYGHQKVYFLVGVNKVAPDFEAALWRARNVAGPHRAQQLGKKTPCAVKADRCYDCKSPDRVCNAMVTLWGPMTGMETEILLVDEDLGL